PPTDITLSLSFFFPVRPRGGGTSTWRRPRAASFCLFQKSARLHQPYVLLPKSVRHRLPPPPQPGLPPPDSSSLTPPQPHPPPQQQEHWKRRWPEISPPTANALF
uniref:Uncharacterized protein n=1 Tax=Leersia perrieri TaxID=77586 RepID=A0A0D9XE57_9ORYZ